MGNLVTFDIAEGNPGALTFIMQAYEESLGMAELGFQRMRDNGILGDKLYMIWNDCCGRDTKKAVKVINENSIEDIMYYLNYERGRGIPYED